MPVVTITQRKGGVGKTTIAVSLAGELSLRGRDVALVDSDPQRSCGHWAQPGHLTFPVYEIPLSDNVAQWVASVGAVRQDYVIIDTAPHERSVAASIALADLILVPCTASGLDLEATSETLSIIRAVRKRKRTRVHLLLVPNRVDRRALEGRQLTEELEAFGEPLAPFIGARTAFVRAFSAGCSVADLPGAQAATEEIRSLCNLVEDTLQGAKPRGERPMAAVQLEK